MSLRQSATAGIRWSSLSQVSQQIIQILTTIVLAHILSPIDFGLVGMTTVITGFVGLFKDLGTAAAVVQKKNLNETFLSSIFWLNVAFGCLTMLVLFSMAPLIASFYQEPRITIILRVLSLTFLISGFSIFQQATLERNLAFNTLAKVETGSLVFSSLAGLSLALSGAGVWSLVGQAIATAVSSSILLWLTTSWRPQFVFQWQEIKSVSRYSLHLTGSNIFFYFVRNTDDFLIGKFLGAESLGYYTLAYRIMLYPLQNIGAVIRRVMFPIFSQRQEENEWFRYAYLKVVGMISIITFPIVMGLIVVSQPLILTLFGTHWSPTIPLLLILLPAGLVESIETSVSVIYQAKGRTDWMFRLGIITGLLVVLAFVIGLQWGVTGVAVAYVCTLPLSLINFWVSFKLIHLPMWQFCSALWRSFLCSLLMLGILLIIKYWLPVSLSSGWILSLLITLGGIVYFLASWFLNREQIKQVLSIAGVTR